MGEVLEELYFARDSCPSYNSQTIVASKVILTNTELLKIHGSKAGIGGKRKKNQFQQVLEHTNQTKNNGEIDNKKNLSKPKFFI